MTGRRRRWLPWVLGLVGLAFLLFVFAVVGLVLLLRNADKPAEIAEGFAPPTELPRSATPLATDRLVFDSDRTGTFELFTMALDGSDVVQLGEDDPATDAWWPKVSPDRRTILFYKTPAGSHDRDFTVTSLWAMAADGTGAVELRPAGWDGWTFQGHAEFSTDGSQLVMFGGSRFNPQIHVTDPLGQQPRQVTDRPGTNIDPAFSPDGTQIVFIGCPEAMCTEGDYELYRIPTAGGEAERLTADEWRDHDPYWSPDGTRLAWLTQTSGGLPGVWDVRVGGPDAEDPQLLAKDDGVTSKPQFSPDGRTIYVHRIPPGGDRFGIYAYPADGGEPVELTAGQPGTNEYPAL